MLREYKDLLVLAFVILVLLVIAGLIFLGVNSNRKAFELERKARRLEKETCAPFAVLTTVDDMVLCYTETNNVFVSKPSKK